MTPLVVDLVHPSVARVYDYFLDGSAHWAIDREFGQRVLQFFPEFQGIARGNRMFVNRVVRYLATLGVRQFLDIGSGAFSAGNTHQIADEITRGSRVIYADNEPVTVAHGEALLDEVGDPDRHAIIHADLCDPDALWRSALDTGIFDPDQPIAVLMFAVLHGFEPNSASTDISARSVARYRDLVPVGSYLGISHITNEGIPQELVPKLASLGDLVDHWGSSKVFCRTHAQIRAFFGDFELLSPEMVWTPEWHPEVACSGVPPVSFPAANHAVVWAGVGRKRAAG